MALKPARFVQLLVLLILAILFYAEFVRDVDTQPALEYYRQQPQIVDADNAAFAFAGLAAPPGTADPRSWGFVEVMKNRERLRRGEARIRVLDDRDAGDGRLYLRLPAASQRYACWLPSFDNPGAVRGCVTRNEMLALLEQNRILLQRYQKILNYADLYYRAGDNIGFEHSVALARLLAIDLWLRRDRLGTEDVELLFRFFRFWERRARDSSLALVGTSMAIVNYGVAASLLARLSEIDPGLLLRYRETYGEFDDSRIDERHFDNFVRAEFRSLNRELCFFTDPDATLPCTPSTRNLYFKPGRTLQLLYQQRLGPANCGGQQRANSEAVDSDFWTYLFKRPGNFRGRGIALLHTGGMRKACTLFSGLNLRAEQNRLRNLYLRFKAQNFDAARIDKVYASDREQFRIPGSDDSFEWDRSRQALLRPGRGELPTYVLPYR